MFQRLAPACLIAVSLGACSDPQSAPWTPATTQDAGDGASSPDAPGDAAVDLAVEVSDTGDASHDASSDMTLDAEAGEDAIQEPSLPAVRALLDVIQDETAGVASVTANAGFSVVYAAPVDVLAGDTLRIFGQVEMTNDYKDPVRGLLQLFVDGVAVSPASSENAIVSGSHHMPMWADARILASSSGTLQVEARYAAARGDASPVVKIEEGYGHLMIERYRTFPSRTEAAAAGARVLESVVSDTQEDATSFGGTFANRAFAYSVHVPVAQGDLVRLWGQGTSGYNGSGVEMHGQGLFVDKDTQVSPWSTENDYWDIQTVPLFTDGLHMATGTAHDYVVSMHGVAGAGCPIVAGGGQLHAMVFRTADAQSGGLGLVDSLDARGSDAPDTLIANAGWKDVLSLPLGAASPGDVYRLTAFVQLARTGSFALGISCSARLTSAGKATAAVNAPRFDKYVTQMVEVLPMRVQQMLAVAAKDDYETKLSVQCTRDGADPELQIVGGSVQIVAERFAP